MDSYAALVSGVGPVYPVGSGDLPAIKVGGRGQWRVEASELEGYIARMYAETADFVRTHPLGRDEATPVD